MTEIKSLSIDELKSALKEMGEKPFRAGQIFKWLHEGVESFEEMSNLSKDLRARLAENFLLTVPEVARKQVSRVDGTVKYLWRLRDGNWSSGAMDGKGWLAVALVIFALWKPLRAVWGSVLFGALMIMYMRVTQLGIPTEIYKILPYVVTVIVLISISIRQKRENQPPASLGNAYFREER